MAVLLSTLWIGPSLGLVERACLRSAMNQGHQVTLYSYDVPDGVPGGVEVADAADIVPRDRIVPHRSGSMALFSDLFRYALMERGPATWIDSDVYLLRPIDGARAYLFGRQSPNMLNGAVLRLPTGSPMLRALLAIFDEVEVPDWLSAEEQQKAAERLALSGRTGVALMPWGSAGPNALTALAKRFGVYEEALPQQAFYPVHFRDALWVAIPQYKLEKIIGRETVAVHLWASAIRHLKDRPAQPGSFLERLQIEGR